MTTVNFPSESISPSLFPRINFSTVDSSSFASTTNRGTALDDDDDDDDDDDTSGFIELPTTSS
jgi:hypothetical protein